MPHSCGVWLVESPWVWLLTVFENPGGHAPAPLQVWRSCVAAWVSQPIVVCKCCVCWHAVGCLGQHVLCVPGSARCASALCVVGVWCVGVVCENWRVDASIKLGLRARFVCVGLVCV